MNTIEIPTQERVSFGKNVVKALRRNDAVPCVVYGRNETFHLSVSQKSLRPLIYTSDVHKVILKSDARDIEVFLQDFQVHPVTEKILHVDFIQRFSDRKVSINVPVRISGNSVGVLKGGALRVNMRKVRVKGIPDSIPSEISLDVTDMEVGGKVYVSSLRNDTYELLHPDNAVLVQIKMSRASIQAATETQTGE